MKKAVSILIDHSGSMGRDHKQEHLQKYLVGKRTRMELAQEILRTQIVPSLVGSDIVIIQTFKSDSKGIDYKGEFIQESDYDEKQIVQAIMHISLPAAGGTPISAGILEAIKRLSVHSDHNKILLIITDGEETGDGNYVEQLKKIGQEGFCKVHIIGLGLDSTLGNKAKIAADSAGGIFTNILLPQGVSFESIAIDAKTQLFELKRLLNESITQIKSSPSDTISALEDEQLNERIRVASEKALFHHLGQKYGDKVHWLNDPVEAGGDHDFEIIDFDSNEPLLYIECKGTPGNKPTFYLTANEWRLALKHGSKYELYFVQNCFDQPKFTQFINLITSLESGNLLPYSLEEEHLQAKRIAMTVAST
ncbi:protein NO VEIN domain-containing protein [Hymenobacter terrenus]|uniref:protein NO VEIN domain-containing protein n=1 Tax=Hymenobacter terrenus TaxID=1629124 RepID=UPI00061961AD|nr:DUF3883 domain-containing protein [Hymenobacter terrenus]